MWACAHTIYMGGSQRITPLESVFSFHLPVGSRDIGCQAIAYLAEPCAHPRSRSSENSFWWFAFLCWLFKTLKVVFILVCEFVWWGANGDQKRSLDLLELVLKIVLSCLRWCWDANWGPGNAASIPFKKYNYSSLVNNFIHVYNVTDNILLSLTPDTNPFFPLLPIHGLLFPSF